MDGSCPAPKLNHMYHALPEISLHKLFCVCALAATDFTLWKERARVVGVGQMNRIILCISEQPACIVALLQTFSALDVT
jgi:hypothetical protein